MLLLQDTSTLSKEESWLRIVYANIVSELMKRTVKVLPYAFDPFSANYCGLKSVQHNKYDYQALLEVTSFFWSSKGGRGVLIEKIIALESGSNSANGVSLSKIFQLLESPRGVEKNSRWQLAGSVRKLKFDLVNIMDNRILLSEIKNRVDSGGTAARGEALKKFLKLSKMIQDGQKVFVFDNTTEMDIAQTLLEHGIKKIEMHVGFLFNIDGNEATVESDIENGFYRTSSKLLTEYYQEQNHRHSIKIDYDQNSLRLSFEKDGLAVSIEHLYGSEVTRRFTKSQLALDAVLGKVFTRNWDDIWLTLNLAISQRALLLERGSNQIIEIKKNERNRSTDL